MQQPSAKSQQRTTWAHVQGQGLSIGAWLALPVFMLVVVSVLAVFLVLYDSNTRPDITMFSWSLLAMLIVASALAVWAVVNISQELRRLGIDALNVGSGAGLMDVESDIREVSDVRGAMAEMSRQISISMQMVQEQNEELAASNAELEDRVNRRTSEMRGAMETAERASRAKGLFIANLSHEVRTPLNAVIGVSDLLARSELNAAQVDMVQTIRTSSETLLALINDVLDFSKIESGKLDLESRPFELRSCVEAAVSTAAVNASRKGLELAHFITPDCPRLLVGDEIRLRQVLFNLLGNAVKFTSEGSVTVTVEYDPELSCLSLAVKDSGIGIEKDVQARLFSAFEQGDASMTRRYGGTGLGLAICKGIVDAADGTIELFSEKGLGTLFTVTLPIHAHRKSNAAVIQSQLKGRTVKLEVSATNSARMLALQLQSMGVEVVEQDAAVIFSDAPPGALRRHSAPIIHVGPLDTMAQWTMQGSSYTASRMISIPCRSEDLERVLLRAMKVMDGTDESGSIKAAQAFEAEVRLPTDMQRMRLLLAEDNAVNRKVIGMMLDRMGIQPVMVENGRQAVNAIMDQDFDVVLMDLQMPELDGIGAMQEINRAMRTQERIMPMVFALTANALEADRDMAIGAGMRAILSKPIKLGELRQGLIQAYEMQLRKLHAQGTHPSVKERIIATTLVNDNPKPPSVEPDLEKTIQHTFVATQPVDAIVQVASNLNQSNPRAAMTTKLDSEQINELLDVLGLDELYITLHELLSRIPSTLQLLITLTQPLQHSEQCDWHGVRQAAHALAGSAMFVGANELGDGLKACEAAAVARAADQVKQTVTALSTLALGATGAIEQWMKDHPRA